MRTSVVSVVLLASALAGAAPRAVHAAGPTAAPSGTPAARPASVAVSVQLIKASKSGTGVAAALKELSVRLQRQFPQFTGFEPVGNPSRPSFVLQAGQSHDIVLPNQQTVRVGFVAMDGTSYKLALTVPGGTAEATSPANGMIFFGGPPLDDGTLILAIRTGPPS